MPKYRSLWYPTSNIANNMLGMNRKVRLESVIYSIVISLCHMCVVFKRNIMIYPIKCFF